MALKKHAGLAGLILAGGLVLVGCAGNRPAPVVERNEDTFYKMTRFIMTSREARIYRGLLSPEARRRFIEYFWEIRDPNPLSDENEFRQEIQRRFEHVQRYFQEGQRPGWRTDRGRFYMILGPPEQVERNVPTTDPRYQGRIIDWYYGFSGISGTTYTGGGFRLRFVDERGFGSFRLDERYLSLRVLDVLEELKLNMIVKQDEDSPFPAAIDFQVDYNARAGEIAVSFKPEKVAFERSQERISVHLYVTVLVFGAGEEIDRFSRDWQQEFNAEEVLKTDFRFRIPVAVKLGPGKHTVDVVLTDMMSGRKSRRILTVK